MHKRKSTDAQLRTELIGFSPLPGSPPAAYGSIIIPCACHGRHRGQPGLSSYQCCSLASFDCHGAPTNSAWSLLQHKERICRVCIQFSRYMRAFRPFIYLPHGLGAKTKAENEKIWKKFWKQKRAAYSSSKRNTRLFIGLNIGNKKSDPWTFTFKGRYRDFPCFIGGIRDLQISLRCFGE